MKQIFFCLLLLVSVIANGQSLDGYYERADNNGQIIERLIITQDYFEQYIFEGDVLKIGTGNFKLNSDSITFTYEKKKPFKVYRLNYTFSDQKSNKFVINCKLDTTNYSTPIDLYRVIMYDKTTNEIDATNGFTSTNADTVDVTQMAIVVDQYYKRFNLSSGHNKHDILIELDNTKTSYLYFENKSFRISESTEAGFSLELPSKEQHNFIKNDKNEKEFREYLNMKNQIETEL